MPDEESRAAEYRAQARRRMQNERARRRQLRGSPDAAKRVQDAWQPVKDWITERDLDD